jgi:hypothetical protein
MKISAILLFLLLCSPFQVYSQKDEIKFEGTSAIGKDILMKNTEVTIQEWMVFIVNNDFDSTLFPAMELLSGPVNVLYFDLKKGKDFKYLKITNHKKYGELGKLSVVEQNKQFHEDSKEEEKELFLGRPVTAISFEQAKRYCLWMESRVNSNQGRKVNIDLPTDSIYFMVIPSMDSINSRECSLFNYVNCDCTGDANEHDGEHLVKADAYFPTYAGIYNLLGNAAEMTHEKGKAMGGSFRHYAKYAYSDYKQVYDGPEDWLGFRYVVTLE